MPKPDSAAGASAGARPHDWLTPTIAYALLAIVMTWPLTRDITKWIAWDMGDAVFNSWVLMWTGGQLLAALSGNFNAIHSYFDGNIFYPESLTIAYSEHLTPQMLQALPVWLATDNIVLTYNLLFLSTFVISGLGMFLFVRDLTGRRSAAFIAGLAFAFAPYRISQYSHLQVLSSYWMPFVLLGLRRYFVTRRTRPLVGAAAALTLQNLSCGYYLLFFTPFVGLYALYELSHRRLMRDWRVWRALTMAAAGVAIFTWPFVKPYFDVRKSGDVGVRPFEEIVQFSADTHSFATSSAFARLWGVDGLRLLAYSKAEGEGFPGFTILILGGVAMVWGFRRAGRAARIRLDSTWRRVAGGTVLVLVAVDLVVLSVLFVRGNLPATVEGLPYRNSDPWLIALVGLPIAGLLVVPAWRRAIQAMHGAAAIGFFIDATVLSALLSLGPRIQAGGQLLGHGPYHALWAFVPGFDGVRVPARFLMIVALFLAVLAGIGAAAIVSRWPRARSAIVAIATAGILAESWVAPMQTNVRLGSRFYELPPRQLLMGDQVSPIYQFAKRAPGKLVLIEFPFGEQGYEILSTFYAGYHRRPLVNGYSGFFPADYLRRSTFLSYVPSDLDAATKALSTTGATHALVHEGAFPNGRGHEISDWLVSIGARPVMTHGTDKLFQLK